jgi:hypothetical protein
MRLMTHLVNNPGTKRIVTLNNMSPDKRKYWHHALTGELRR